MSVGVELVAAIDAFMVGLKQGMAARHKAARDED